MDILSTLQKKREVNRMQMHPLSSLSLNEKYTYCFGLAILTKGNMKTINELSAPFEQICHMLSIEKETSEEMIIDINNNFDSSFNYLMQVLSIEQRISNCFMIDLLKLSEYSEWGKWYCDEVIEEFRVILKISAETFHFFSDFLKERKHGDSPKAHQLVNRYEASGNEIDYELLHYMNEEYLESKHFDSLLLNDGGCYRIECSTVVDNDIVVENGTKLYISNTTLSVGGSIKVKSGRVEIRNSLLEAIGKKRNTTWLIELEKQHLFVMEDSTLDCHFLCSGIKQIDGNLNVKRSFFYRIQGDRALNFSGKELECIEVTFSDCLDGALWIAKRANVELLKCQFENCRAEHGGAIHSATTEKVHIRECTFTDCYAKYLGAAIYFEFKRYGQEILGCRLINCEPKKDEVFNAYTIVDVMDNHV